MSDYLNLEGKGRRYNTNMDDINFTDDASNRQLNFGR